MQIEIWIHLLLLIDFAGIEILPGKKPNGTIIAIIVKPTLTKFFLSITHQTDTLVGFH